MNKKKKLEELISRLESAVNMRNKMFEADEEAAEEAAAASQEDLDAAADDPEIQQKIETISKALKDAGLVEYVADINAMMSDEKGKLALELFAGTIPQEQLDKLGLKNIKFKFVSNKATNVAHLRPTQNEIGFPNSLKKPIANKFNCVPDCIKGQSVKLGIPIITCNNRLIIDGHHRWSQVACVNPDATMECLDLQIDTGVSGIDFADAEDVLKVTQSLIMAVALKAGKTQLPSADSESLENLYALSGQQLFDKIVNFNGSHEGLEILAGTKRINQGKFTGEVATRVNDALKAINDERLDEVKKDMTAWENLDGDVKAAVYLTANCLALPKPDEKATLRKYMPQTNGGDDMNISQADLDKAAEDGLNVKENKNRKLSMTDKYKMEKRIERLEQLLKR